MRIEVHAHISIVVELDRIDQIEILWIVLAEPAGEVLPDTPDTCGRVLVVPRLVAAAVVRRHKRIRLDILARSVSTRLRTHKPGDVLVGRKAGHIQLRVGRHLHFEFVPEPGAVGADRRVRYLVPGSSSHAGPAE